MQKITITHTSDAGQRIDRFCKKYLPNAALGGIYKMLRTGKIKINGKKKEQTYKLELGDEIAFWISDEEIIELQGRSGNGEIEYLKRDDTQRTGKGDREPIVLNILYEDDCLMVINKPSGLNVHAGDHKTRESNLIDQVQDYLRGKYDSLTFRPALVHRIDRDTSGCIIIAKEKNTLEYLLEALQSHKIQKIYHACVSGIPIPASDTIRARLLRIEDAMDEAKVRVDEAGQSAVTHYRIIKTEKGKVNTQEQKNSKPGILGSSPLPTFSLLECRIETGRTHQIRVHLAHIGCPIIGDRAYGDKKLNAYMARKYIITRQMLHARGLVFIHPITKKCLKIIAPYPVDFLSLLSD